MNNEHNENVHVISDDEKERRLPFRGERRMPFHEDLCRYCQGATCVAIMLEPYLRSLHRRHKALNVSDADIRMIMYEKADNRLPSFRILPKCVRKMIRKIVPKHLREALPSFGL